jgi:hypothetical protein
MLGGVVRFDADEDKLLILAKKIPERIRQRVLDRPDASSRLARLDDEPLDWLLKPRPETELSECRSESPKTDALRHASGIHYTRSA